MARRSPFTRRCAVGAAAASRQRAGEGAGTAVQWQKMLDYGVCGTIEELAKRERVNRGYMKRVVF